MIGYCDDSSVHRRKSVIALAVTVYFARRDCVLVEGRLMIDSLPAKACKFDK